MSGRVVATGAVFWAAPFAVAPPFLSRDVYAYVAQGQLLATGLDPYRRSVNSLGSTSVALRAVDPFWRHTIPPYGPLTLRIAEFSDWLGGGSEIAALAVLRTLACLSVMGCVLIIRRGAPPGRRETCTWLAASPLVLLQLIAAVHIEAELCLLVLGAVRVFGQRRYALAAVLTMLAAELKVTALLVLMALLVQALRLRCVRQVWSMLAAAAGTGALGVLLLPSDPLGWTRALATPGRAWAPFTPWSTILIASADLSQRLHRAAPLPPWLLRSASEAVGAAALVWLLGRVRQQSTVWLVAMTLLIAALSGPVLWPWYLAPCALLMALASPLAALVLGTVPSLAALPIGTIAAQRVSATAELAGAVVLVWTSRRTLIKHSTAVHTPRDPSQGWPHYGAAGPSVGPSATAVDVHVQRTHAGRRQTLSSRSASTGSPSSGEGSAAR